MKNLVEELFECDVASSLTNRAARRIEELEKALKNLSVVSECAAWAYNFSMCDEEIDNAKKTLRHKTH